MKLYSMLWLAALLHGTILTAADEQPLAVKDDEAKITVGKVTTAGVKAELEKDSVVNNYVVKETVIKDHILKDSSVKNAVLAGIPPVSPEVVVREEVKREGIDSLKSLGNTPNDSKPSATPANPKLREETETPVHVVINNESLTSIIKNFVVKVFTVPLQIIKALANTIAALSATKATVTVEAPILTTHAPPPKS